MALAPLSGGMALAEEQAGDTRLQTFLPPELWSNTGEDAISFGRMRPFANLKVLSEAENGRFYALNPRTNGVAYLERTRSGRATTGRVTGATPAVGAASG